MTADAHRTLKRTLEAIDTAGRPLTKEDWKDFLENLIDECNSRLDAIKEDLRDEG